MIELVRQTEDGTTIKVGIRASRALTVSEPRPEWATAPEGAPIMWEHQRIRLGKIVWEPLKFIQYDADKHRLLFIDEDGTGNWNSAEYFRLPTDEELKTHWAAKTKHPPCPVCGCCVVEVDQGKVWCDHDLGCGLYKRKFTVSDWEGLCDVMRRGEEG